MPIRSRRERAYLAIIRQLVGHSNGPKDGGSTSEPLFQLCRYQGIRYGYPAASWGISDGFSPPKRWNTDFFTPLVKRVILGL
jgi:hypothetical protein